MLNTAYETAFKRRILVTSNVNQTIDNEMISLIIILFIYCLNCIRRDQNATYNPGHSYFQISEV